MRTVRLYGELGKRFGRHHRFDVKSPAEALRALMANFKSFQAHMIASEARGIGYTVRNGSFELASANEVTDPASGEIRIIPRVIGAGGALGRILIGAALVAAAFLLPLSAAGTFTLGASLLAGVGVSLALGGVAQLLAPPPKSDEPSERPENKPSYLFNGPVNTTAQGQPVPIGYGRLIVGGAVISAGITLEQLKGGFKRTKTEATTLVEFNNITGVITSGAIPANWFKRELISSSSFTHADLYRYYYYTWTVVPA